MNYVMEQIEDTLKGKNGTTLPLNQQLLFIKAAIEKEMEQQKDHAYKLGMKQAMNLIKGEIEEQFGQL